MRLPRSQSIKSAGALRRLDRWCDDHREDDHQRANGAHLGDAQKENNPAHGGNQERDEPQELLGCGLYGGGIEG